MAKDNKSPKSKLGSEAQDTNEVSVVAGPLGFEPRTSGSAGRCHNPY